MPANIHTQPSPTITLPHADTPLANRAVRFPRRGPVILAASGARSSDASAIVAALIAERLGVPLVVTTVIAPLPIYTWAGCVEPLPLELDTERWTQHQDVVRHHIADALGTRPWTLAVRSGQIAREICEAARELGATLVVVSAAPHRSNHRYISGVRAAQILRHAPCPVLSVAPDLSALPRTVVAAVDFGSPSVYAVQTAIPLIADDARVTLVNVPSPVNMADAHREPSGERVGAAVEARLAHVRQHLEPYGPSPVTIETVVESGMVADTILARAEADHADLITVGTHGPGMLERFFVGSVAADLLHLAAVSVLAAPAPPAAAAIAMQLDVSDTAMTSAPEDWKAVLEAFSARNVGSRVTVEIDDPTTGAQIQAHNYVFQGMTYDPHDHRVECMFGTPGAGFAHLTRTIERVQSIAIKTAQGRDVALEIRHDHGHTMLLLGA